MPPRYERKQYVAGGMYHIFNRGVNKAVIFHCPDDYLYFTECIMLYLVPRDQLASHLFDYGYSSDKFQRMMSRAATIKNYADEMGLFAYCLMPNHFHFLIEQKNVTSMPRFMKSLLTRYAMYYALKYQYVGHVFQGRYKAILVNNEAYFHIVTNYIHQNPTSLKRYRNAPDEYPWSSANNVSGKRPWLKKGAILTGPGPIRQT